MKPGSERTVDVRVADDSFSVLYPAGSDEKRWVDAVLARKKSLGF